MSKQTLSVQDFVIIVRMLENEINKMVNTENKIARMEYEKTEEFYNLKILKDTVDEALYKNQFLYIASCFWVKNYEAD